VSIRATIEVRIVYRNRTGAYLARGKRAVASCTAGPEKAAWRLLRKLGLDESHVITDWVNVGPGDYTCTVVPRASA